jgi:chromosome condensin MukBEF ATPase and DNA-binding subunit MukB
VTTLLSAQDSNGAAPSASKEEVEAAVAEQGEVVKQAKATAKESGTEADQQAAKAEIDKLLELKQQLADATAISKPVPGSGAANYEQDFFGKPAYLAVSGQLNGALLSSPYTMLG